MFVLNQMMGRTPSVAIESLSSLWNAQRVIMVKVHVARMRKESVFPRSPRDLAKLQLVHVHGC
jgi:hypothetical protein